MEPTAERLLGRISASRLAELTFDLVRIKSYTGETVDAAAFYARHLTEIGLAVETATDFPSTPVVVGRLRGGDGPTLTLNGHLDTVPVEHPPARREGDTIYGRGAADMKSAVAAMAEVARVLVEGGVHLKGTLQLIAHGRHEAPLGYGEDLAALVRRGLGGDAAIVTELGWDELPVVGMGMAIFTITIARPGEPSHELMTPAGTPHPLLATGRVLAGLERFAREIERRVVPRIGPESLFVGEVHGGDFYNRFPNRCRIVGTRRYGPEWRFQDVRAELEELLRPIAAETGCEVELHLQSVKESFEVDESEPIVRALRGAYQELNGRELPLAGIRIVADAPIFIRDGGVPCVYHGIRGHGAHGDLEYVEVPEIVRATEVYLLTALRYLGYRE
ncbi:MAG TPA: M20 family metallopeptidase [Chloroflexota bacterium]|jgi:acetylornithine deacetylase